MDKNYKLLDGRQFHFHDREEGYDYTLYDERGKEIDGGILEYDFENEKELPEWEIIELLANFADLPELLEKIEEIEEIIEKPTYLIKVWETEEEREEGISNIIESGFTDIETAVKRAKELWLDNNFASMEVQVQQEYIIGEVIYFCDNNEEKQFVFSEKGNHFIDDAEKMIDFQKMTREEFLKSYSYLKEEDYQATLKELETRQKGMIKIFKLYHSISTEIKAELGALYIVHEIENRFMNSPELYDRFTQDDKEAIFELSHEAWVEASHNIGSYTIVNALLDAVIENKISIEELAELSSHDVLDIAEDIYPFDLEIEEEYEPSVKDLIKEDLYEKADLLPPDIFDIEKAVKEVDEFFDENLEEEEEWENEM